MAVHCTPLTDVRLLAQPDVGIVALAPPAAQEGVKRERSVTEHLAFCRKRTWQGEAQPLHTKPAAPPCCLPGSTPAFPPPPHLYSVTPLKPLWPLGPECRGRGAAPSPSGRSSSWLHAMTLPSAVSNAPSGLTPP